jgi:hypothetical protein
MNIHTTITSPIDALGQIKAEIAALEAIEAQLREQIIAMGNGTHSGLLFDASVSGIGKTRDRIDWKGVATYLKPSHQLKTAYTTKQEVITVRVASR